MGCKYRKILTWTWCPQITKRRGKLTIIKIWIRERHRISHASVSEGDSNRIASTAHRAHKAPKARKKWTESIRSGATPRPPTSLQLPSMLRQRIVRCSSSISSTLTLPSSSSRRLCRRNLSIRRTVRIHDHRAQRHPHPSQEKQTRLWTSRQPRKPNSSKIKSKERSKA